MENLNQKIIENIKQEEAEIEVPDQFTVEEFVGDIKHEPERHFVFIMPEDPEPEIKEVKEMEIVLRKFDRKWNNSARMFRNYFACNKCDYVTKKLSRLNRHFKTCKILQKCGKCFLMSKSENGKKCGFCDLKFDCKNCKKKHINQDHFKGSTWHCTKCDYSTLKESTLRSHYQIHVKKFSCETCKQKFAAKQYCKRHQQQHRHGIFASEPETKFDCEKCIRSFATQNSLKFHERQFHSKLKFHCDICGKTTKTKIDIRNHIQTHFKVPCPICKRMFAERCLKRHIEEHSSITSKFKCDECEKVYVSINKLIWHKKERHEINEVQCDLCSKVFKNKLLIRKHVRGHLKVPCPICSKQLIKLNLKKHIKVVHSSGEKSLACHIARCKQRFKNVEDLKDHEKIHVGPGIFKCLNCHYQSKALQNINNHIKSQHKVT